MRSKGELFPFGTAVDHGTIIDSGDRLGADCNRRITDVYLVKSSTRTVSCHVWGIQQYFGEWIVCSAGNPAQLLNANTTRAPCN